MATIHHQVWINAPVSKVYEAISTAQGLSKWWAPHKSTQTDAGLVLSHSPGGEHGDVRMKVVETVKDSRVEWEIISAHPRQSPASAWTGTHIIFELSERGNPGPWLGISEELQSLTVLAFRHAGWDESSEYFGFCNFAWGATLLMLKQWCESGEQQMTEEKILTKHPLGKSGRRISKQTYELFEQAILSALRGRELTHTELMEQLGNDLKGKFSGKVSWYAETMKLDLEARRIIERTSSKPQKYRTKNSKSVSGKTKPAR